MSNRRFCIMVQPIKSTVTLNYSRAIRCRGVSSYASFLCKLTKNKTNVHKQPNEPVEKKKFKYVYKADFCYRKCQLLLKTWTRRL